MGLLRLLGGLVGIALLLALLTLTIWLAMWLVLLTARKLPMIGRRHRHDRWTQMHDHAVPRGAEQSANVSPWSR